MYYFCNFTLCFDKSVGSVSILVSDVFVQQELSTKVVDSLHYFGAQSPDFSSKFQNKFL